MKYKIAKVECSKEDIKRMLDMISIPVYWTAYSTETKTLNILIGEDAAETIQSEVLGVVICPVSEFRYVWEDYPYEMHEEKYSREGEMIVRYTNTCGCTEYDCWDSGNEIREETSLSDDDFLEILEDILSDKKYVLTELY